MKHAHYLPLSPADKHPQAHPQAREQKHPPHRETPSHVSRPLDSPPTVGARRWFLPLKGQSPSPSPPPQPHQSPNRNSPWWGEGAGSSDPWAEGVSPAGRCVWGLETGTRSGGVYQGPHQTDYQTGMITAGRKGSSSLKVGWGGVLGPPSCSSPGTQPPPWAQPGSCPPIHPPHGITNLTLTFPYSKPFYGSSALHTAALPSSGASFQPGA